MSVIGNIAGVPLFTTVQETLSWASSMGLSGYHMHNLNGQRGYMGGVNHQQATGMPLNTNAPPTGGSSVPSGSASSRSSGGGSSGSSGGGGGY